MNLPNNIYNNLNNAKANHYFISMNINRQISNKTKVFYINYRQLQLKLNYYLKANYQLYLCP